MALNQINIFAVVAAVDPASIGAVGAGNTDVAVAGVVPGDYVIPIAPVTLEAGLAPQGATVPSAGTVRLRLTNASAGAIDGAALTWNFLIIRIGQMVGEGSAFSG